MSFSRGPGATHGKVMDVIKHLLQLEGIVEPVYFDDVDAKQQIQRPKNLKTLMTLRVIPGKHLPPNTAVRTDSPTKINDFINNCQHHRCPWVWKWSTAGDADAEEAKKAAREQIKALVEEKVLSDYGAALATATQPRYSHDFEDSKGFVAVDPPISKRSKVQLVLKPDVGAAGAAGLPVLNSKPVVIQNFLSGQQSLLQSKRDQDQMSKIREVQQQLERLLNTTTLRILHGVETRKESAGRIDNTLVSKNLDFVWVEAQQHWVRVDTLLERPYLVNQPKKLLAGMLLTFSEQSYCTCICF